MKFITLMLLLSCLLLTSCTLPLQQSIYVVNASKLSFVSKDGYAWKGCGSGADTATRFTAYDKHRQLVHGIICCSDMFKACTVWW